ncbi:tumor necrosis factor receptor superfamily member 27 isoform X2 [Cuculus canorus]|uniref:tumor necrosis factor receptor superfamily member 27 isoform X2 n=1 Tax=Cuculus canorus TaxID=55661 RepID=UPI0023AB14C6|nr:tumor necrosis factor receptor superfamily member 27 isoform X2 [Cuculus canorus]
MRGPHSAGPAAPHRQLRSAPAAPHRTASPRLASPRLLAAPARAAPPAPHRPASTGTAAPGPSWPQWSAKRASTWMSVGNAPPAESACLGKSFPRTAVMAMEGMRSVSPALPGSSRTAWDIMAASPAFPAPSSTAFRSPTAQRQTMQSVESACQGRSRINLVKVAVPTVPPQDTALLALTSSALVIIVLVLLALSIIYCKRFWKSQCQRVFLRTQNFSGQRAMFPTTAAPSRFLCEEQMSGPCCLGVKNLSPCYRQAEGPVEVVQFISDGEAVGLQLPSLQLEPDLPPAVAASAASKAQLSRSLLESQPLIRASGRDCLAGVLPPADPRQGQPSTADALVPLSSCASEMQHKWPHAPVECTELDLQKFSTQTEFVGSERPEEAASRVAQRIPAESGDVGWEGARHPPSTFPNPTAESGEQPVDDAQSFVTQISSMAKGLPIAELPHSLVQSLAFLLDPSLNGVKNFSHLGLELGVAPQLLGRISGFEQLVAHFTYSGDVVTVPLLAQALQQLQRFDALLLLCDHFTLSPAQGRQC